MLAWMEKIPKIGIKTGFLQGSVLSPFCFLLCSNYLLKICFEGSVSMFAHGTTVNSSRKRVDFFEENQREAKYEVDC